MKELEFVDVGGPPVLRHTGATHLVQHESWSLTDVQVRGRWGALKSVLHYLKPHLLIKNEERTPEAWHERAAFIWEDPRTRLGLMYPLSELSIEEQIAQRDAEPALSQDELERAVYPTLRSPEKVNSTRPNDQGVPILSDLLTPVPDTSIGGPPGESRPLSQKQLIIPFLLLFKN